jgi:transcription elongation factor Elf1
MKNQKKIQREPLPASPQNHLFIHDVSFTCPNCSNKIELKFSSMIFRILDFYCGLCGTRHKVSNPAFSNQRPILDKQTKY